MIFENSFSNPVVVPLMTLMTLMTLMIMKIMPVVLMLVMDVEEKDRVHQPRRFSSCITSCSWTQCGKETMKVLQYDGTNWFNGSASKKCLWSDYKVITHNKIATISCVALYMSTIGVLIAAERMTQIPTDTSSHIPQQQWLHHAWPIWTGCSTAGSKGGVRPAEIGSEGFNYCCCAS